MRARLAFSQIMPDEKRRSATAFLKAALGLLQQPRHDCRPRHDRQQPAPAKAGAERFIQTALREGTYDQAYPASQHRAAALPAWLHRYNWHRPHGSLDAKPPISRLGLAENNRLRRHS